MLRAGVERNPGPVKVAECKSHENRVDFWKKLWNKLRNSKTEESRTNSMWQIFKLVTEDSLKQMIQDPQNQFSEAVIKKIGLNNGSIPYDDESFDETFYKKLFQLTRNKGCQPLDESLTVTVTNSKGESQLSLSMLEETALLEQDATVLVPEQLLFKDHLDCGLSMEGVINTLNKTYEEDLSKFEAEERLKNKKITPKNAHENAKKRAKANLDKNPALEIIKKRQADMSEEITAKAVVAGLSHGKRKGVVLCNIETKKHLGSNLEKFGVKLSVFPKKNSEEVEHDVIAFPEPEHPEGSLYVCGLLQVKRPSPKFPWSTDEPEARASADLAGGGVAQLNRDVCRVLEIVPDVDATQIEFRMAMALPDVEKDLICEECLTGNPSVSLFNKRDLEDQTKIKKFFEVDNPIGTTSKHSSKDVHKKLIGRYLGNLSLYPYKTKADMNAASEKEIHNAGTAIDTMLMSTLNQVETEEYKEIDSLIDEDHNMSQIKEAMIIGGGFLKKLKKEKPDFPWTDVEVNMTDKQNKFLQKKDEVNAKLIIGKELQRKVICAIDEQICHQGKDEILNVLQGKEEDTRGEKQKKNDNNTKRYAFLEEEYGKDMGSLVSEHVEQCAQCAAFKNLKHKIGQASNGAETGPKCSIPTQFEQEVLSFGDSLHQGYSVTLKRLERWCWFSFMEEKVSPNLFCSMSNRF